MMLLSILLESCPFKDFPWTIYITPSILSIIGLWAIFNKAKQPGWAAIIPFYNVYILTKVICRPWWWIIMMFIPFVNLIFGILMMVDLAHAFKKGTLFTLGLVFLSPLFLLILGFDSSRYIVNDDSIR